MECPKCGANNADGKLYCYRCGAELILTKPPGRATVARKKVKKKRRPSTAFFLLFLILLTTLIIALLILGKPKLEPLTVSEELANKLSDNLSLLKLYGQREISFELEAKEEEINSYLHHSLSTEGMLDLNEFLTDGVALEELRVNLKEDELDVLLKFIKRKRLYLFIGGKLSLEDSEAYFTPHRLKLGRLPLPARLADNLMRWIKKGDPLKVKVPPYIKDVKVASGSLIIQSRGRPRASLGKLRAWIEGGDRYYAEGQYLLALKEYEKVVREAHGSEEAKEANEKIEKLKALEELERQRREREASNLLQFGDNFYRSGNYSKAKEYYQRIITEFPQTNAAGEARKRLQEIKVKEGEG